MTVKRNNRLPAICPWELFIPTQAEAYAVQAMLGRVANPEQQGHFVKFLDRLTGVWDLEFRPDGDRASTFASGKRHVGLQFHRVGKLPSTILTKLDQ